MKINKTFRTILAILGGEIALILFATVAQEVLFNGIRYNTASNFELLFGGFATFAAAILAGIVARLISKKDHTIVPLAISIIITVEMTYLILTNKTGDPTWFDILGGSSLILGIWMGFYYPRFLRKKKRIQVS